MILDANDIKILRAAAAANKFVADRRLSDKDSSRFDRYSPQNWHQRLPIIPTEETPSASGYGYVQSPYTSQWTKLWGMNPIVDFTKYRMIFRTVPIVKKAIDKTVSTAISKGFELDLPTDVEHRDDILAYLKSWIDQQEEFKVTLQMLASDMLVYGVAYAEIVYDEIAVTEESSNDPEFYRVEIPDPKENFKMGDGGIPYLENVSYNGNGRYLQIAAKGNPVWLKPLDPLWMRVRRDSYGNRFGFLQYLSTPPVAFTNDKMVFIRFNPKSWWTENWAGTSALMSLIRTQEAIWTIENDLILISHACAKPPLVFACGDNTEEPWTEGQFTSFVSATSARGPGGDIYHRGDVQAKPLPFPASSLAPLLAHLDYHVEQRMISLGVPPDLLGIHASSNRSVATVSFDDWINTIQLLQQQMGDAIQEQLFKTIIEKAFGEGCPVPNMVWNQVYEKDDAAEIQKVMTLRASNIITTNEARAWLGEVGKKLEPVTGGDTLLPPQAFMPTEEEDTSEEMPSEDSILEDDVEIEKIPTKHKAEEEYTDVVIKKPFIYKPKKEEEEKHAEAEVQGLYKDKKREAKLPKKKDTLLTKIANKIDSMGSGNVSQSNPYLRAEQGNLSGQSNDDADYPKEEKDLRGIKLEKLKTIDDVDVWLIDAEIAAQRYDPKWTGVGNSKWIGSHHFVMEYVDINEVWISDQVPVENREKVITHELTERDLMSKGMSYYLAHREALKTEGLTDAEVDERSYIEPEQIKKDLGKGFPNLQERENEWALGDKTIVLDETAGIIYVRRGEKIIDQQLIRSSSDIEKFVTKYRAEKVEL